MGGSLQAHKRYRKHHQISQRIKDAARVPQELKGFLLTYADQPYQPNSKGRGPNKDYRVDRRLALLVKAGEPVWKKPVPTGDHRQTRVAGELNARLGDANSKKGYDCDRNDLPGKAELCEP